MTRTTITKRVDVFGNPAPSDGSETPMAYGAYRRTRERLKAPRPATCPIDHGADRRCLWATGHPGPCLLGVRHLEDKAMTATTRRLATEADLEKAVKRHPYMTPGDRFEFRLRHALNLILDKETRS